MRVSSKHVAVYYAFFRGALETYVRICYDKNMINRESQRSSHNIIHGIKKADLVLIVGCLLAAALLGVFFIVHRETGSKVRILCDGIEMKTLSLDSLQTNSAEAADGYYLITLNEGAAEVQYFLNKPELKLTEETSYNLISVSSGTVVMEEADCKDQICVHHKPVTSVRESIICLPHRLVVEIVGDDASANTQENDQDRNPEEMPYGPLDGVVR